MNEKEVLIQVISAIPDNESFTLTESLTCEISTASLVCLLGQHTNTLNAYMEMLAGVNKPYSGSVNYSDDFLKQISRHIYSAIAYIYHNSTLLSILNGVDNVKAPALYHHIASKNEIDREADILLAELEYGADHRLLPAFMSTLQKRHLLIVRAIMLKPKILFIENPFMGLDRQQVRIFGQYLAGLVNEKNITVITSNVNLDFVQSYADQIIYLTSKDIQIFKQRDEFFKYIQVTTI